MTEISFTFDEYTQNGSGSCTYDIDYGFLMTEDANGNSPAIPSWLTFDEASRTFTVSNPPKEDEGTYAVTICADIAILGANQPTQTPKHEFIINV